MTILRMSLKISFSWKRALKWLGWSIVVALFLVFFIRVVSYENYYYNEKDGSERVVTGVSELAIESDLIEEKPDEQEIREYTVPADHPRYLSIDKLKIRKSRILSMGVNGSGALDTPRNIFDVGWYNRSGLPGQGGTLVIDGHNGGPRVHGVFKDLPNLTSGDIITVERGDGEIFRYSVMESKSVPLSEADQYMAVALTTPVAGKESVTLISCTGEWSQQQGTYLSRQFVRAVLVEE